MTHTADPVWPVVLLALVQVVDGLLCLRPVRPIARCLDDVGLDRRVWWVLPVVKFAAAAGLVASLRLPVVGAVTGWCLVAYFVLAVGAHVRARDLGRNLFVNATGMLALSVAVTVVSLT